jgi:hypothetical protein
VPWLDFVQEIAASHDITINTTPSAETISSDNAAANSFNVPNFNMGYWDYGSALAVGGVHYASHLHSPYDNMDRISGNEDIIRQMTMVTLATILSINADTELRLTPEADKRAIFVASHTESVHTSVNTLNNLSMTLAMFGYDVDVIPYGQTVTSDKLADADLVVILPVFDYALDDLTTDESWSPGEIEAVKAYVADNGLLIVSNTWRWFGPFSLDTGPINEDWDELNSLVEHFGVTFNDEPINGDVGPLANTPLLDQVDSMTLGIGSAVNFSFDQRAMPLIGAGPEQPLVAGVDMGDEGGLVLIIGDFGMLRARGEASSPTNLRFWFNLARFASEYANMR